MPLHLEWRPVGDVLVIQCQGRIVAGKEVLSLHNFVGDSLSRYGDIVLELEGSISSTAVDWALWCVWYRRRGRKAKT